MDGFQACQNTMDGVSQQCKDANMDDIWRNRSKDQLENCIPTLVGGLQTI